MREFLMILMLAGCFYFVAKQFAMNIALVFEDDEKNGEKGR